MIKRSALLILLVFAMAMTQNTSDPNFQGESVHNGNGITCMKFLPNGDFLGIEKRGFLLYHQKNQDNSYTGGSSILDLQTFTDASGEGGLLGLEIDPDLTNNPYVYLFVTTSTDQQLLRYTLNGQRNGVDNNSQQVLLSGLPRQMEFHNAGDIRFSPSDPNHIYIALGDDGDIDGAQNLDIYHGKILRVKKTDGMGAEDNPFYTGDGNTIRSRVWAYGFRNPFRIAFTLSLPGVLFASENGGPQNQRDREDRIIRVTSGGNCAWSQESYRAGATSDWYNPPDAGCTFLVTTTPSVSGIAIAESGPWATDKPMLYWGKAFGRGIYRYEFTDATMTALTPYPNATNEFVNGETGVHFEWGPDGSLYSTNTGNGEAEGGWMHLTRYNYTGPAVAVNSTIKNQSTVKYNMYLPWLDYSTNNPTAVLVDLLGRDAHIFKGGSITIGK